MQQEFRGFSVKEIVVAQIVSNHNNDKCETKYKVNKNHLLNNVLYLQNRVNNLNVRKRKNSFAIFKVKQQNIFGLVLIDTRNLVHSAIILGEFWEAIGGNMSKSMDYKVGTADGQSDGLQVLGIGEPLPIYLEGMEEC